MSNPSAQAKVARAIGLSVVWAAIVAVFFQFAGLWDSDAFVAFEFFALIWGAPLLIFFCRTSCPAKAAMITAEQVIAARMLLNWSQISLADSAGVNVLAVIALEIQRREVPETAIDSIKGALERAGVEFPEGEPVRLKTAP